MVVLNLDLMVKKHYHSFRKNYIQSLYECCLDPTIKQKLIKKIKHHEGKLLKIDKKLISKPDC